MLQELSYWAVNPIICNLLTVHRHKQPLVPFAVRLGEAHAGPSLPGDRILPSNQRLSLAIGRGSRALWPLSAQGSADTCGPGLAYPSSREMSGTAGSADAAGRPPPPVCASEKWVPRAEGPVMGESPKWGEGWGAGRNRL